MMDESVTIPIKSIHPFGQESINGGVTVDPSKAKKKLDFADITLSPSIT